jgi:hypothetical protein
MELGFELILTIWSFKKIQKKILDADNDILCSLAKFQYEIRCSTVTNYNQLGGIWIFHGSPSQMAWSWDLSFLQSPEYIIFHVDILLTGRIQIIYMQDFSLIFLKLYNTDFKIIKKLCSRELGRQNNALTKLLAKETQIYPTYQSVVAASKLCLESST